VRPLRALGLTVTGFAAGFVAATLLAKRALPSRGDELSDEVALAAIFDGIELRSRAQAFRGGSMLAWFGGIAVDLREARLAPEAHLSVTSVLGGVALKVPAEWRVEATHTVVGGGVEVDVPEPEDEAAPLLRVDARAVLGGVAIKASERDEPKS
jgi:hypothetical protein